MNNDLISRSALREKISSYVGVWDDDGEFMVGMAAVLRGIDSAPAVDAAEVVRCKDCERREKTADLTNDILCPYMEAIMPKNAFCSYGERRGDK